MAFVVDDLVGWLVGLLADAGRKKLTALLLGSEQERALRRAATAAIQSTAVQLAPSGGVQAEQLAMVVGEVFRGPPRVALAGQGTLLEALQAGIAAQLAVRTFCRQAVTMQENSVTAVARRIRGTASATPSTSLAT